MSRVEIPGADMNHCAFEISFLLTLFNICLTFSALAENAKALPKHFVLNHKLICSLEDCQQRNKRQSEQNVSGG